MAINPQIFRAYDIRGIVEETLTAADVFAIGQAIASKVISSGGKKIVIGRDGRLSGPLFAEQLSAGILSTGCDVVDVGMVPTPALYFASKHLNIDSAVMLTGSHNPSNYNGLKIIIAGVTIYGATIQELYQLIMVGKFPRGHGEYSQINIVPFYIAAITKTLEIGKDLKVVIDCGNGVPGLVAPDLYRQLGCDVITLYCDVDGTFPNHHPDPSNPQNLQDLIATVKQTKADIGLAFDGDGDRLGIVDNQGKIIWPDRLLMLFAREVLAFNPGATIIYDVKCSRDVEKSINEAGGEPLMWNTGHSLIKAKMAETGAVLAAEMSGHIFFKDRWYGFDDALYTAARLIEILSNSEQTSAEVFAQIPEMVSTPELNVNVTEESKFNIMQALIATVQFSQPCKIITLDGIRVEFEDGWGLVRPSNTTPKLVARFEAVNEEVLNRIKDQFSCALLQVAPELELPF